MVAVYDTIGQTYSKSRRADPRILAQILALLRLPQGARLADIGAGTGNYSNALAHAGFQVSAVEPSATMRAQAAAHPALVWLEGRAEAIPLPDDSVDGVVATLAFHHFASPPDAAREMHRICPSGPKVIFTSDPREGEEYWFAEYFPTLHQRSFKTLPPIDEVAAILASGKDWEVGITPFPLPHDLIDLFREAAWRRPELYLDEMFRANNSGLSLANPAVVDDGLSRLRDDLKSGAWDQRYGDLRRKNVLDAGFRFISCRAGSTA